MQILSIKVPLCIFKPKFHFFSKIIQKENSTRQCSIVECLWASFYSIAKSVLTKAGLFCLLCLFPIPMKSESLWQDDAGYRSNAIKIKIGDILQVRIDTKTAMNLTSSRMDNKMITLEIAGGEADGLLNFLPIPRIQNNNTLKGKNEYSLSSQIAVLVQNIDENGVAAILGNKSTNVMGTEESILLSGFIQASDIKPGQVLNLQQIAGLRIVYKTFLEGSVPLLSARDLNQTRVDANITRDTNQSLGTATAPSYKYELTQERKRQLLLLYLNKFLDLIFR